MIKPDSPFMLTIKQLQYAYRQQEVLKHLDLEIPAGEIHGILGPNGAGKTTLFRLIAGWLKPRNGTIRWGDTPLNKEHTAFLETDPYFYPYTTGMEHLRLICDRPERIGQWNQLFDLPLKELADDYSTGMQKKLAFMGVLLQERPVLILDEPFNGVDFAGNEVMMAVIRRLGASNGITLVSSHVMQTLTHVCDRISVLKEGRIEQTVDRPGFASLEAQIREETTGHLNQLFGNWP